MCRRNSRTKMDATPERDSDGTVGPIGIGDMHGGVSCCLPEELEQINAVDLKHSLP